MIPSLRIMSVLLIFPAVLLSFLQLRLPRWLLYD